MKFQNLLNSFLRSTAVAAAAVMILGFSAGEVSAQGGSGRITPNTGTVKKKATTTVKKAVNSAKKTTTSRNVKKPVTAAKNFNYYYNLGQAAYNSGNLPGAITNYTQAITLNPRSADAYYNRGLAFFDSEDYNGAISDYTQSIRILPQADAYNNRGLAYENIGNDTKAAADFREALRLNPSYTLARTNLNRIESGGGDEDEEDYSEGRAGAGTKTATISTKNRTTTNTADANYYNELADEQYNKRDFANALINYTKSIKLDPDDAAPYVRRGFIYHYTGYVVEAYDDYETAARLDPSLKTEPYIKCMLYSVTDDNANQVIADCTRTINEFPTFSLAYYKRGVGYYQLKNYTSSLTDFNKSVQYYPQFFNSMVYRGLIYNAQKNYVSAIAEYTSAIRIIGANDSRADLSYVNRGRAYEAQGNYALAAADYRKAIALGTDLPQAQQGLDRVTNR